MPSSGSPTSSSGFFQLLQNRSFLLLWCGQGLSQIADKVFFVLLISLLVNYQTPDDPVNSMRSALMIAATLPAIFLGSAAGIFVDRFEKKHILTVCNYLRGALTLLIPVLPTAFFILLAIAFLESILTQFFAPAEQAAIPLLVSHDELMPANALFTTTIMGALIVGFAIGEPLLSMAKLWNAELGQTALVGGLYILAGGILQWVKLKEPKASPATLSVHPWSDFKAGLRYLRQNPLVSNAMMQLTILYSVFAALTILAIQLAQEIGLKSTQFGFLLAASGIGMVLGAAFLGHWGDRFHHKPLPLIGFIIMASMLAIFAVVNDLWLGLTLSAFLGIGASLIAIPMQTLIQRQTPETMRGKVFGFQNNVINIALSAPLAIAGPLTDMFGLSAVLLGISVVVALGGIWAWKNTHRVLEDVI
ncbi:MAG: MFS transporter [Oculatellaceae cyanobacterium bins.114]|nr:MFS transporter [Oculatellaceae cyanobacterium bins.114]